MAPLMKLGKGRKPGFVDKDIRRIIFSYDQADIHPCKLPNVPTKVVASCLDYLIIAG